MTTIQAVKYPITDEKRVSRGTDIYSLLTICYNSSLQNGGGTTRKECSGVFLTCLMGERYRDTGGQGSTSLPSRECWLIRVWSGVILYINNFRYAMEKR